MNSFNRNLSYPLAVALFALTTIFAHGVPNASGATVPGNLALNPSFETPLVPAGGFTTFGAGSTLDNAWTVAGGDVSIVSGTFAEFGKTFPAADGAQWLDMSGPGQGDGQPATIGQRVATTPGATYTLYWSVGNASGYGNASTVEVFVDGAPAATSTNAAQTNDLTWQPFSHVFTATGASVEIAFKHADPGSPDNVNALDDISLVGSPAVVPPDDDGACEAATAKLAKAKAKLKKLREQDASKDRIDRAKEKVQKAKERKQEACA